MRPLGSVGRLELEEKDGSVVVAAAAAEEEEEGRNKWLEEMEKMEFEFELQLKMGRPDGKQ